MSAPSNNNKEKFCPGFEPQLWRKRACKWCFKSLSDHSSTAPSGNTAPSGDTAHVASSSAATSPRQNLSSATASVKTSSAASSPRQNVSSATSSVNTSRVNTPVSSPRASASGNSNDSAVKRLAQSTASRLESPIGSPLSQRRRIGNGQSDSPDMSRRSAAKTSLQAEEASRLEALSVSSESLVSDPEVPPSASKLDSSTSSEKYEAVYKEELSYLRAKYERLAGKFKQQEKKLSGALEENRDLQCVHDELAEMKVKCEDQEKELSVMDEEAEELSLKLETARKELKQYKTASERSAGEGSDVSRLKHLLTEKEKEMESELDRARQLESLLSSRQSEVEDLRSMCESLQSQLEARESHLEGAEGKVEDLQTAVMEYESHSEEAAALVKTLNEKMSEVESDLTDSNQKIAEFQRLILEKDQIFSETMASMQELKRELTHRTDECGQLRDLLEQSEQTLTEKEAEIRELSVEVEEMTKHNELNDSRVRDLADNEDKLREAEGNLQDQQTKIAELQASVTALKEKIGELEAACTDATTEAECYKERLDDKNVKIGSLSMTLEDERARSQSIDRELHDAKRTAQEKGKLVEDSFTERMKMKTEFQREKEVIEEDLREMRRELDRLKSQTFRLEREKQSLLGQLPGEERAGDTTDASQTITAAAMEELERVTSQRDELDLENDELRRELQELKLEMDEMEDRFRDSELDEFREIQRELEITTKNCRILQFRLRKSERQREQAENERETLEHRTQQLRDTEGGGGAVHQVRELEEELQLAKEVSVRLHDELEHVEERRQKYESENTELREKARELETERLVMEKEIEILKDELMKHQGKLPDSISGDRSSPGKSSNTQIVRDLYDALERENDLKEQLKFTQQEVKATDKKKREVEDENDSLVIRLEKVSAARRKRPVRIDGSSDEEGQSSDGDEMHLQLELLERENESQRRRIVELEGDVERLEGERNTLHMALKTAQDDALKANQPLEKDEYYEQKLSMAADEADQLKWKLIEKERELEGLRHGHTDKGAGGRGKLQKSRSLDETQGPVVVPDNVLRASGSSEGLQPSSPSASRGDKWKSYDNLQRFTRGVSPGSMSPGSPGALSSEEVARLRQDNARYKAECSSMKQLVSQVKQELETVRGRLTSKSSSRGDDPEASLVKEVANLKAKMDALQRENTEVMTELEERKKKALEGATKQREIEDASKEGLVAFVKDLHEEIEDLLLVIKTQDDTNSRLEEECTWWRTKSDELKDEYLKYEKDLLEEIQNLECRNTILQNLLDVVTDRAETAEQQLGKLSESSESEAKDFRQASVASGGSDDVFEQAGQESWEKQFEKRVRCLETLLKEERAQTERTREQLEGTKEQQTTDGDNILLLKNELSHCYKLLHEANGVIITLKEDVHAKLKTHMDDLAEWEEEKTVMQRQLKELGEKSPEFNQMKGELERLKLRCDSLEADKRSKTKQIDRLNDEVDQVEIM